MKIIRENLLRESDGIDSLDQSTADLAKDIQNEVEQNSDDKVSIDDKQAKELATEIKKTADVVDADQAVIVPPQADEILIENRATEVLDAALVASKKHLRKWISGKTANLPGTNVLICGLPGSGKTAIVETWCAQHGLICVSLNARDAKIDTTVNGMPLRDMSKGAKMNALIYNYGPDFDPLLDPKNEGKCVLFVDEFNRQRDDMLRSTFFSLFNEKRDAKGTRDFRKTLLFTVVCINPYCEFDPGAEELTDVEKSRFTTSIMKFDSTPAEAKTYFYNTGIGNLLRMGVDVPEKRLRGIKSASGATGKDIKNSYKITSNFSDEDMSDIEDELRIIDITSHIFSDSRSKYIFNTNEDRKAIHNGHYNIMNARLLTNGIREVDGDKQRFINWLKSKDDTGANILPETANNIINILNSYNLKMPELKKSFGVPLNKQEQASIDAKNQATPSTTTTDNGSQQSKDYSNDANGGNWAADKSGDIGATGNAFTDQINSFF